MTDGSSTDEIWNAVEQGISVLDAARMVAISHMTGISIEKLIELGGIYEGGEHPAVRVVRDHAAGKQDDP